MKLEEFRKINYDLERDSDCEAWKFYLGFYEGLSDEKLKKYGCRLVHPIDTLPNTFLGGDVIINTHRMPERMRSKIKEEKERYSPVNIGLLPCQGNFQIIKNRCGSDFRIDLFIKMINDYYISGEIEPLLYKAKMWKKGDTERQNYTKQKLEDILKYYGGIQKFVRSVYGINDEAFVKYLVYKPEERDEEAIIDMIESFWDHRMKEINKKRKSIGMV